MQKEAKARIKINKLLEQSGWRLIDTSEGSANVKLEGSVKIEDLGEKYPEIKEIANNICNTYGRRGVHFLKDIWVEYNK